MSEYYSVKLWMTNPSSPSAAKPTESNPFPGEDTSETLYLHVEQINKSITRNPMVVSLPELNRNSGSNPGEPYAFSLDLGMIGSDTITINGVSVDKPSNAREVNPPIDQIERYVRTGWRYQTLQTSTGSTSDSFLQFPVGGCRITIPQAPQIWFTYPVAVVNYRSDRSGGEQFWKYSITFQVLAWPPVKVTSAYLASTGWKTI